MFRNWISMAGFVVVLGSLFASILLFAIEVLSGVSNPYVGVLTYMVAPAFLMLGLAMAFYGAWMQKRKIAKLHSTNIPLIIDLARLRDRRILVAFIAASAGFLLLTALGSYHTYHFTESVQFCGQVCHTVMKPELVTYQHSPHARVLCAECHIGSGATWYVKSKLSGAYQVYSTIAKKYPRPVPTPVKNLRPAQETCEKCHWPQAFVGNVDRTFTHFLGDETNTMHTIRMSLKVGGADPSRGPVGGIHWHMNVGNKIEYAATDPARQVIPYVRMTDSQGAVTEFRTAKFTNDVATLNLRKLDCMDCHNRPSHQYKSPNKAVDLAMALGKIDVSLPYVKTNAVWVLMQTNATEAEGVQKIATMLNQRYPTLHETPKLTKTIAAVQEIYRDNFFPEMNANWKSYPDDIGHKDWPGCARCHDDKHKSSDGKQTIKFSNCNACHTILAQGNDKDLEQLNPKGVEFKHPGEAWDPEFKCTDCHTGGL